MAVRADVQRGGDAPVAQAAPGYAAGEKEDPVAPPNLSARAIARIASPRFAGELTQQDAEAAGCTLIATEHGAQHAPEHIRLTMLVAADGTVRAVRYLSPAGGAQLAAYDVMAELCQGRSLAEAALVTPRQVDALLRDQGGGAVLELVASGAGDADHPYYVLCKAAERHHGATAPAPAPAGAARTSETLPWSEVGLFEKVRRIEGVLDAQVRPALASDGGGIDLVDLKQDDLHVQYHGACGSCSSSIGGTLQFIQDSLNNNLGTNLTIKVAGLGEAGGDEGLAAL
jgi:NifU-like protein